MSALAVWQPTDDSAALAQLLLEAHAIKNYEAHINWRRNGRMSPSEYRPEGFRGDVDMTEAYPIAREECLTEGSRFSDRAGLAVSIMNCLGPVDWHEDYGFPTYSYFLVLRNKEYEVSTRNKRFKEQPNGCIIRLNVLKEHTLRLNDRREKLYQKRYRDYDNNKRETAPVTSHSLWLAAQFDTYKLIDDPQEIYGIFERAVMKTR